MSKTYSAQTAAAELGLTDGRIRQICIESWEKGDDPIGADHAGTWLLTQDDVDKIRARRKSRSADVDD